MKLYQLRSKQVLPISLKEAWDFLSDPKNLKTITPEHMGFHILSGVERPMFSGQVIQYTVKPFPLFSVKWVTEITHVVPRDYFVDEQRFGPYALWHHKHFLKEIPMGVEMEDVVDYKLPWGLLGRIAHTFVIKKQLKEIFAYRAQKLKTLFGSMEGEESTLIINSI
ncbi:MAG: SRPBCC family protein [Allomuricauda sp.]